MDDVTFLRRLADRNRVVLLAGGVAVPLPVSVMDDPARAGSAFQIDLISPEGDESGDRRTFLPGTIEFRELPLPLLWQWQLSDGHKYAVVVGRIDHIERTPKGLGNARGVFDSGPWGREAERMVRNGMLRFVSGDYTNFAADVVEKVEDRDNRIQDDKVAVKRSKLVAATIVAKPAFEGCHIEILDEEPLLPDGIVEGLIPITAAAALRATGQEALLERLRHLEAVEQDQLALTASAIAERVNAHRLQREREAAIARIRGYQNITAAWKPLPSSFLSAKAKLQPRDSKGRWIEMGSMVRWRQGLEKIGGVQKGGKESGYGAPFKQGRVKSFDAKTGEYEIEPVDGSQQIKLAGKNLEVVQAVIPDTPEEAQKISGELAAIPTPQPDAPEESAPTPTIDGLESDDTTPADVKVGLDRLNELMGAEIEPDEGPIESDRQAEKRENREVKQIARNAEDARIWPDREEMGRQIFNNVGRKTETWEKDGEKYMRAADRLKRIGDSRLVSKKRRGWIQDTYGKDAPHVPSRDEKWQAAFAPADDSQGKALSDLGDQYPANEVGPLSKALSQFPEGYAPKSMDPETDEPVDSDAPEAAVPADPDKSVGQDAVKVLGEALVESIKALNAKNTAPQGDDDPLAAADKALENGTQWGKAGQTEKKMTPAQQTMAKKLATGEVKITGGKTQLQAIQQRSGLTDEEMAGAAELLPKTESLRDLVESEDFMSEDDMGTFHAYLDEVQIGGARSSGQWDAIHDFVADRRDNLNDDQYEQVLSAVAEAREESLDAPGEDTIESLSAPAPKTALLDDLPDQTDDALTVPADWQTSSDNAPASNLTVMAKTMFENLFPDQSWDEADQSAWIESAKKAQENNDE